MLVRAFLLSSLTETNGLTEIGLSMARRQSQSTGVCPPSKVSEDDWVDYRKAWRALIFFSSWLSSTLGYISGVQEQEFTKLLPVCDDKLPTSQNVLTLTDRDTDRRSRL
jgi:hypothetical protein